jgi:hypothetical protein
VGFVGVVLSLLPCRRVYLTDVSSSVTRLIDKNLATNSHLASLCWQERGQAEVRTRVLDWRKPLDFRSTAPSCSSALAGGWTQEDTEALTPDPDVQQQQEGGVVWVAADVIYDDEITRHFFLALATSIRPGEHLFLALEKRVNFELASLSLAAHGYQHFLTYINMQEQEEQPSSGAAATTGENLTAGADGPFFFRVRCNENYSKRTSDDLRGEDGDDASVSVPSSSDEEQEEQGDEEQWRRVVFRGTRVPLASFPQAVRDYERGPGLELWDISCYYCSRTQSRSE